VPTGAGFAIRNGAVTQGAIVAWKVVDESGVSALQAGWVSRDIAAPLPPAIVNGVIFVVSGASTTDARRSDGNHAPSATPAILYGSSAQVTLARARERVGIECPTTTARGPV
jgi:hypothetical protein